MKKGSQAKHYDLIVIGAGIAGLSAAMYGSRMGLKTLCLGASSGSEMAIGGMITTTKGIENYPGLQSIDGNELAERIKKQAESYSAELKAERVEKVEKTKAGFAIKTQNMTYEARSILFATGAAWRKLNIPGAKEFENRGVAYCALCDGPLFKDKVVGVIGGSDTAVKDALILAEKAKKVYLLYRGDKIHGDSVNLNRLMKNKNIKIITKVNVVEIRGDKKVNSVVLDRKLGASNILQIDGVFVAIGTVPLSELVKNMGVKCNEKGEIVISHKTGETDVAGIYAAGDVSDIPYKQAIIGAAGGCIAARSAFEYLRK